LTIVATALDIDHPMRAGMAAMAGGCIIEFQADAAILWRPLFLRLPDILRAAAFFWDKVVRAMPQDNDVDDEESYVCRSDVPDAVLERIGLEYPFEDSAFQNLEYWCLPAVTCLATSATFRREAAAADLINLVTPLVNADQSAMFLHKLLRVIDDERLLVLHPESRQGYECVISGISSNTQLHTLLADALVRDVEPQKKPGLLGKFFGGKPDQATPQWLPGDRPSANLVAVVRGDGPQQIKDVTTYVWVLHRWRDLNAQGNLPKESDNVDGWLWYHGCPDDFEKFQGYRVVLLSTPEFTRVCNTDREFSRLRAFVSVTRTLPTDEVEDWLGRMSALDNR